MIDCVATDASSLTSTSTVIIEVAIADTAPYVALTLCTATIDFSTGDTTPCSEEDDEKVFVVLCARAGSGATN